MTETELEDWLTQLARKTLPQYRETMVGIANHFRLYGYLSAKQRQYVHINASKQKMEVPAELKIVSETQQHENQVAEAMAALSTPEPEPTMLRESDDPQTILTDLFRDMALALMDAANRLDK